MVGAEPLQGVGQGIFDGSGAAIDAHPVTGRVTQGTEFDADDGVVAVSALEGFVD